MQHMELSKKRPKFSSAMTVKSEPTRPLARTKKMNRELALKKGKHALAPTHPRKQLKTTKELLHQQFGMNRPLALSEIYDNDWTKANVRSTLSKQTLQEIVINPRTAPLVHFEDFELQDNVDFVLQALEKKARNAKAAHDQGDGDNKNYLAQVNQRNINFLAYKGHFGHMYKKNEMVNILIADDALVKYLPRTIVNKQVTKVLLVTDTEYQQTLPLYGDIVNALRSFGIKYVEYTNVQPYYNMCTIRDIAEFATEQQVEGIVSFGSAQLTDIVKYTIGKLTKPTINFAVLDNSVIPALTAAYHDATMHTFSIVTMVTMDPEVNGRTEIISGFYPEVDPNFLERPGFESGHSLLSLVDNSSACFICPDVFKAFSKSKLKELLVECFYRFLILCTYPKIHEKLEELYIRSMLIIKSFLNKLLVLNDPLSDDDFYWIALFVARNLDGEIIQDCDAYEIYYLEGGFSVEFNTKRSDIVALLTPYYFEIASESNLELRDRLEVIGHKLFQRTTVNGLVYELLRFNEFYGLPQTYLSVPEIYEKGMDHLERLLKKGSNYFIGNRHALFLEVLGMVPVY